MEASEITKRHDRAKTERDRLQPLFNDALRLTMPGRKRFDDVSVETSADDIFDETGANAVSEFTSRMQAGLIPPFTEFLKLDASSLVDDRDKKSVNKDLDEICKYAFEEIWASNFTQESAEALNDMAISTGLMIAEEGPGDSALRHRAVPITDFYIEKGADDGVGGVFREVKIKAQDLEARYPKASIEKALRTAADAKGQQDKELTIIEYGRRNISGHTEKNEYNVLVKDHGEIIQTQNMSGVGSSPFLPFRWGTAAGETWGRGPLLNAMGAIRTTNLMVELILENAAMSIVGIYQTDNEGVINADSISLLPGTILAKEVGTNGLEAVNGHTGNFNMQDVVLSDQRVNIKRALYNDMLSDPNKTPATATEVAERMADLAHRTSAGFARVFYEFVQPYMRRVLYILEKRGDIELPVKNGRPIQFRAVSPLAQAQHGRDVQKLVQDFQVRSAMFGPQVASSMYDMETLHNWLQKNMGLETKLYKSAKDVVKAMQAQAENLAAMQAQAQPQQAM